MNTRAAVFGAILLWLGSAAGCATSRDVVEAERTIVTNDNSNKEQILQGQLKAMTGDVAGLRAQIEEGRAADTRLEKALTDERDRLAKQQDILGRVATIADTFLGGLATGQGPLKSAIDAARDSATSAAIERSKEFVDAEASKRAVSERDIKAEIDAASKEHRQATRMVEDELAKLGEDLKTKLTALSQESKEALRKAGELGPEELRNQIKIELSAAGVTKEELKAIETLSPEALYALLAFVLGGGAAGGGLLSKLGKSRASEDVGKLNERLNSMDAGPLMNVSNRMSQLETELRMDNHGDKTRVDELFDRLAALEKK